MVYVVVPLSLRFRALLGVGVRLGGDGGGRLHLPGGHVGLRDLRVQILNSAA